MDAVDHTSGVPPYRQVADSLRARIETGELAGRLPPGAALTQEYGVALSTLRKAIAVLRGEGLIETSQGWGSRVVPPEQRPGGTAPRSP